MLKKLLLFPFWLVGKGLGSVIGVVRLFLGLIGGIVRFVFSHLIGTMVGAVIGLFLGRRHVGVKLFPGSRKKSDK